MRHPAFAVVGGGAYPPGISGLRTRRLQAHLDDRAFARRALHLHASPYPNARRALTTVRLACSCSCAEPAAHRISARVARGRATSSTAAAAPSSRATMGPRRATAACGRRPCGARPEPRSTVGHSTQHAWACVPVRRPRGAIAPWRMGLGARGRGGGTTLGVPRRWSHYHICVKQPLRMRHEDELACAVE